MAKLPFSRKTTYAVGSQVKSADLNALEDWLVAGAQCNRIHRNWVNDVEQVAFATTGTGAAAGFVGASGSTLLQGGHLRLHTAANADFARGRIGAVMAPPQLANYAQILMWDVDATEIAGVGTDCDLFMGIMELGAYDNTKGSVAIYKNGVGANWKILHCAGAPGPVTTVDTGVAASADDLHRMAIVWAGDDFAGGPFAKFYIDEVLVHTAVANLPNDPADLMYVTFDLMQLGVDGGNAYISPFTWMQARSVDDGRFLLL